MGPLSVRALFDHHRDLLKLSWLCGEAGADRPVASGGSEPADMVGYLNLIHPNRIHVFGVAEAAYTKRISDAERERIVADLIAVDPPAIVVADGLDTPQVLFRHAEAANVPMIATALPAARVIEGLRLALARAAAEHTSMHGVLMDVLGMGVLITGESGLGKSELALELISRGHGLVADDVVELGRIAPQVIEGRCPPLLQNLLEVRGLGLLDIRTIFGETAVRRRMKLTLIVKLIRGSNLDDEHQRMPLKAMTMDVLGVPIREVIIPVAAGRNLAVLTEAAVRSTVLEMRGFDATADFIARQRAAIQADDF